ncbi:hypothetical protein [Herpetosiphon geysericola]|uniref:hypothetical protein n=1 Tax=Herpetosiphon geysericola TaxID=70996 RepID=UPI00128E9F21|nr:hypothetical protein [Herpetosiphon geysericola]
MTAVRIFSAQDSDFNKAAAEVVHQFNTWLMNHTNAEIVSTSASHAALPESENTEDEHTYSVLVVYK